MKCSTQKIGIAVQPKKIRKSGREYIRIDCDAIRDGSVWIDWGRRMKGVLVQLARDLGESTYETRIKNAVWIDTVGDGLEAGGEVPVASLDEIQAGPEETGPGGTPYELPKGWPVPQWESGLTNERKSFWNYKFVVPKKVQFVVRIRSHGYGLDPAAIQRWLEKCVWHIGDGHSQGYGRGKLESFDVEEDEVIY